MGASAGLFGFEGVGMELDRWDLVLSTFEAGLPPCNVEGKWLPLNNLPIRDPDGWISLRVCNSGFLNANPANYNQGSTMKIMNTPRGPRSQTEE